MSESYTPTTVQVLDAAVQTGFYSYAEVNRWYEAEIRAAKAEALRGCAAVLEAVSDYAPSGYDQGRVDQRHMTITELLERADQEEG